MFSDGASNERLQQHGALVLFPGAMPSTPSQRSHPLKKLTRNLFVAASLLLSGGISTMAHAQSQTPGRVGYRWHASSSRARSS